jgi:hypothetical protein
VGVVGCVCVGVVVGGGVSGEYVDTKSTVYAVHSKHNTEYTAHTEHSTQYTVSPSPNVRGRHELALRQVLTRGLGLSPHIPLSPLGLRLRGKAPLAVEK